MLFIVATPIGNLQDITLRAIKVLQTVDAIACEDTRHSKILLDNYQIKTPTISYHQHSKISKIEYLIEQLKSGKNIALITDAGTPGISDPGGRLVAHVRACLPEAKVEAIPGPSSLTAALSVAGLNAEAFTFLGFLPHKKGRHTAFTDIAREKRAVVFYESPHRIEKALAALAETAPDRHITVCRELTKIHEEVISGTAAEVQAHFVEHPDTIRGEFVVIVN